MGWVGVSPLENERGDSKTSRKTMAGRSYGVATVCSVLRVQRMGVGKVVYSCAAIGMQWRGAAMLAEYGVTRNW